MSANFYERVMCIGDYANDGGPIDAVGFGNALAMYAAGIVNVAWLRSYFSLTTPQSADVDTLLATQPSTGLLATLVNAKAVAQWPDKVRAVLAYAQNAAVGFDTVAEVKAALGTT